MKLSKALKQKNRLVRKINSLQQLINRDNSALEQEYNEEAVSSRFAEYYASFNELVDLKAKIQQATAPIANKSNRFLTVPRKATARKSTPARG